MNQEPNVCGVVSVRIGEQCFGIPVLQVQDVIAPTYINSIPLAPQEVAGSLNLRGRIVTAIDVRRRLCMPEGFSPDTSMSVIVERGAEFFALLVDDVGDVVWLRETDYEPLPPTISSQWRNLCDGLYRLDKELLLTLNVGRLLSLSSTPLN